MACEVNCLFEVNFCSGLAVVKMLGYANDGTDLVFEYIEGGTLRTAICNKDPRLEDRDNLLSILKQVLNVIFELQSLNVAHGDISVDNVMVS
jgi:tRNA A-37 threonylcarbamoyl transferase component Bud32